jgi:hypothetical protein
MNGYMYIIFTKNFVVKFENYSLNLKEKEMRR